MLSISLLFRKRASSLAAQVEANLLTWLSFLFEYAPVSG